MLFPALIVIFPPVASISAANVTLPVLESRFMLVPAVVSPFMFMLPLLAITLRLPCSAPIELRVMSPVVFDTETSPPVDTILPEVWFMASCAIIVTPPEAVRLFEMESPLPLSTLM